MPSSETPKSMDFRPHAVTSTNIVEQDMYPTHSLHMGRDAENVAKGTLSR